MEDQNFTNPLAKKAESPTGAGNPGELNSAQTQGIGNAIQAGAGLAGTVVGGAMQISDNNKARAEASRLAGVNRADTLKQNDFSFKLQKKQYEREQKDFATKKIADQTTLRFNSFMAMIQRAFESRNKLTEVGAKLFGSGNNDAIKNAILSQRSK